MKYLFKTLSWFLITIIYIITQLFLILWHFNFKHLHNYFNFADTIKERFSNDESDYFY